MSANPQKFFFWAAIHGDRPNTRGIIKTSCTELVEVEREMMPDRFKKWLDEIVSKEGEKYGTGFGISNCGVVY